MRLIQTALITTGMVLFTLFLLNRFGVTRGLVQAALT
jgi:hypothetical protein